MDEQTINDLKEIKKELRTLLKTVLKNSDKELLERIYKLLVKLGEYDL